MDERGAGQGGPLAVGVIAQARSAPNLLTLFRLAAIPFILITILDQHWRWALALFLIAGLSDGLDGLLARMLQQRTMLGAYLDPIADKLLLSTLFIELSLVRQIPWTVTVMVFTRDLIILAVCAALYTAANFRDFRPSLFGKLNTFAQIAAVFFVLLDEASGGAWIAELRHRSLQATMALTAISGLHYVLRLGWQLREPNVGHPH